MTLVDNALSNCPCHCPLLTHALSIINSFPTFSTFYEWQMVQIIHIFISPKLFVRISLSIFLCPIFAHVECTHICDHVAIFRPSGIIWKFSAKHMWCNVNIAKIANAVPVTLYSRVTILLFSIVRNQFSSVKTHKSLRLLFDGVL